MSDAYHGRRRAEPDDAEPLPDRLARRWQLLVILVAAVPAVFVGIHLGRSAIGEPEDPCRSGPGPRSITQPVLGPPSIPTPTTTTIPTATPTAGPGGTPSPSGQAGPTAPGTATIAVPGPPPPTDAPTPARAALVLDNYDSGSDWDDGRNDLGEATDAKEFSNGSGHGLVSGGALTLVYRNDGWFGSDVMRNVSAYRYLVIRVAGASGGEERHLKLSLGGITRTFGDLVLDDDLRPSITKSYQDIRIPMAANGINTRTPGELQFSFWWGGYSTVVIDEIRFE